jgi:hypothetical protein
MFESTDARKEYEEAQKEFHEAQEEHNRILDKYFPVGIVESGQPLRMGSVISVDAFAEIEETDRRFNAARGRFNQAKTEKGKKIVPVKPYVRKVDGKSVPVKPHRRSTPD